jgi:hypothetical protein
MAGQLARVLLNFFVEVGRWRGSRGAELFSVFVGGACRSKRRGYPRSRRACQQASRHPLHDIIAIAMGRKGDEELDFGYIPTKKEKRENRKKINGVASLSTYSVLGLDEGIVDSNDLNLGVLDGIAENNAADTTETVDADLDNHCDGVLCDEGKNWVYL